jgi:DNA repair protein RecO (recombination protein O)
MNDRITGIVLKQTDYKEGGALVTILTRDYGRLTLSARGVRKMNSRNAGSLFPYTIGEFTFDYKENKTIFALKTAHTVSFFRSLHEDLTGQCAAAVIAETADAVSGQQELSGLYDWTKTALERLDTGRRSDLVVALYLALVLAALGIGPQVDGCVSCGSSKVLSISVQEGGFLCPQCAARAGSPSYTGLQLKAFRLLNKADFSHFDLLAERIDKAFWMQDILVMFLETYGDIRLHSWPLYVQVR